VTDIISPTANQNLKYVKKQRIIIPNLPANGPNALT